MVARLFESLQAADKVRQKVLADLAQYVPIDDAATRSAAPRFAVAKNITLPLDQVQSVSATGPDAREVTMKLLQIALPAPAYIVATLNGLGTPYSYLTSREQDEFEVPSDDAHKVVFGALKEADICSIAKKPLKDFATVRLR